MRRQRVSKKCSATPSKLFEANTALVFLLDNFTEDDLFRVEFAPFDTESQCMDNLTFYPIVCGGKEVTLSATDDNPRVFVTPCKGHYRINNMGYDDTCANVMLVDSYEVPAYVKRDSC